MSDTAVKPYPNLGQAFGIFGIYIVFALGTGLIIPVFFRLFGSSNQPLMNLVGYVLAGILTLLFTLMFKRRSDPGPFVRFGGMPLLITILLLILTPALAIVIEPLSSLIPMPEIVENIFALLEDKTVYTGLMVVAAGPLFEEVLFRGLILEGFLRRYSPWKSIVWSSVIFGLFHLNPWQFIPAFILGILMGYVYWKTRSLWLCIFVHLVNNGLSYLALFFIDEKNAVVADLFNERRDYLLSYIISVGIVILGVLWLIQLTKNFKLQTIQNGP